MYGWHHAIITHAPEYRKYWVSPSRTALAASLNLFLRLWLYASPSRASSYTGPRICLVCVCVVGGELDGSLGALPERAEERKLQCKQKAFVLKAAGQAQPSQSSLCPGCAYSLVGWLCPNPVFSQPAGSGRFHGLQPYLPSSPQLRTLTRHWTAGRTYQATSSLLLFQARGH